jgi:hypothetical protein
MHCPFSEGQPPLLSMGADRACDASPPPLLNGGTTRRKEVVRLVEIPKVFIRRTQGRRGAVGEIMNDVLSRSVVAERWPVPRRHARDGGRASEVHRLRGGLSRIEQRRDRRHASPATTGPQYDFESEGEGKPRYELGGGMGDVGIASRRSRVL